MKQILKNWIYFLMSFTPLFVLNAIVRFRLGRIPKLTVVTEYVKQWELLVFPEARNRMAELMAPQQSAGAEVIKTDRPIIFAMSGLPQTGKTSVAYAIAEACGAVVVESNIFRVQLERVGAVPFAYVNEVALQMAEVALGKGYNVIIDGDFANPAKQMFLEAFAHYVGAHIQHVRVSCDEHVWRKRLQNPEHVFGALYHISVDKVFQPEMYPEPLRHAALIMCVHGEYNRQKVDHMRPVPCSTINISSGCSKSVMMEATRIQAWRILSRQGNTPTIRDNFEAILKTHEG